MKRVDEKYSYDELEGFEPVKAAKLGRAGDLWMVIWKDSIRFSKAARETLYQRGYLGFMYNAERKSLLVYASDGGEGTAKIANYSYKGCVGSTAVCKLVEEVTRFDRNTVTIRLFGTVCKSRKGAIMFDLVHPVTRKPFMHHGGKE